MFEGVIVTFRNPYKETVVIGLGVWNPYRKPRPQVWEGRMLIDISESLQKHWKVGSLVGLRSGSMESL